MSSVCTVVDVLNEVRLVVVGTILVTKLETGLAVTVEICVDVEVLVEAGQLSMATLCIFVTYTVAGVTVVRRYDEQSCPTGAPTSAAASSTKRQAFGAQVATGASLDTMHEHADESREVAVLKRERAVGSGVLVVLVSGAM